MCFKKMIICCGQHLVGKKTYFSGYPLFNLYISPMWSCRGNNSLCFLSAVSFLKMCWLVWMSVFCFRQISIETVAPFACKSNEWDSSSVFHQFNCWWNDLNWWIRFSSIDQSQQCFIFIYLLICLLSMSLNQLSLNVYNIVKNIKCCSGFVILRTWCVIFW